MEQIFNNATYLATEGLLYVNSYLRVYEPVVLVIGTLLSCFAVELSWRLLVNFYYGDLHLLQRVMNFGESLPIIREMVRNEKQRHFKGMCDDFNKELEGFEIFHRLPSVGMTKERLMTTLTQIKRLSDKAVDWKRGRMSGGVYAGMEEATVLMTDVFKMFCWTNPLHYDAFPDIRKFEAEIVAMCVSMMHGDPKSCAGSVTSGGTESILLACLAYRNYAQKHRGIKKPEIIVASSAHAAFHKAAHLFDMTIRVASIDPRTYRASLSRMRSLINGSTCMLVASAPSFPYGVVDDVQAIAKLAQRYGLPLHVDCCLGGFIMPFLTAAGFPQPPFDFRVPGVTSISCDTHKYGLAVKGTSVVMYVDRKFYREQIFGVSSWPGGMYATPTLAGSRPGVNIAACWAMMMTMGESGYVEATRRIHTVLRRIADAVRNTPGLFLMAEPDACCVAFSSQDFDIFRLLQDMNDRGWKLCPLQFPSGVHIAVTMLHTPTDVCDDFIKDLKSVAESLAELGHQAHTSGTAALYGRAQTIPDRGIVDDLTRMYIEAAGILPNDERNGHCAAPH